MPPTHSHSVTLSKRKRRIQLAAVRVLLLAAALLSTCCARVASAQQADVISETPVKVSSDDASGGGSASEDLLPTASPSASGGQSTSSYIVRMRHVPPVATYTGGIAGFAPTAAAGGAAGEALRDVASGLRDRVARRLPRVDLRRGAVRSFVRMLGRMQAQVARDVGLPVKNVLYSYKYASNAFAAHLSPAQVAALRRHPRVASVSPDSLLQKLTTDSAAFMRLPETLWAAAGGATGGAAGGTGAGAGSASGGGGAGEGVVVGVVDTGIWPEHPSFSDNVTTPYGPPPKSWRGVCQSSPDFPPSLCNRKLLGARFFLAGFRGMAGAEDVRNDWRSARDADGHGTWCAGAAAGNTNTPVITSRNQSIGFSTGMAPRARLAIYKVFWSNANTGGLTASWADVEAAVNYAVADGVDVISLSLGGLNPAANYFNDATYLNANLAGVTVVYAAGNSGPPITSSYAMYRTLSNFSPFYLTVGASTIPRRCSTNITLGDGSTVTGNGYGAGAAAAAGGGGALAGMAMVEGISARKLSVTPTKADLCAPNSLEPSKVVNRIVVCAYGGISTTDKAAALAAMGARALFMVNVPSVLDPFTPYSDHLPVVQLDYKEADKIRTYTRFTSSPTASLSPSFTRRNAPDAPTTAYFSSTGPAANPYTSPAASAPSNDLLKPDIIAPGVSLWSAWRAASPSSTQQQFAAISGTSMATPHVAGIAALLVQRYPLWTPAQIMSAIMTSATVTTPAGAPIASGSTRGAATPWEIGAGHVNPAGLLDPGLTYNAGATDYFGFLAGQSSARAKAVAPKGLKYSSIKAYNLNRPTIAVGRLVKTVTVSRTVMNVGNATSTYSVSVVPPAGVAMAVSPTRFTVARGAFAKYSVKFTVTTASWDFKYGSLTWRDAAGHAVRSAIAVQPITR